MVRPDAGITVGLQLNFHGVGIFARVVVVAQAQRAFQLLNVVAEFVRDNIFLGQWGIRTTQ